MKKKKKQCQKGDDVLKTFVVIDVFFAIKFFQIVIHSAPEGIKNLPYKMVSGRNLTSRTFSLHVTNRAVAMVTILL